MNNVTEKPKYLQFELSVNGSTVGQLINLLGQKMREKEPRLLSPEPIEGGHNKAKWSDFVGCVLMSLSVRRGNLLARYKVYHITKSEQRGL